MWCSLRPDAVDDWPLVLETLCREGETPDSPHYYSEQARRGGVLYRCGDYEAAIQAIEQARHALEEDLPSDAVFHAKSCFFEAMAQFRLGRTSQAEAAFARGVQSLAMFDDSGSGMRANALRDYFLMGQLLRQEAEELLRGVAP